MVKSGGRERREARYHPPTLARAGEGRRREREGRSGKRGERVWQATGSGKMRTEEGGKRNLWGKEDNDRSMMVRGGE